MSNVTTTQAELSAQEAKAEDKAEAKAEAKAEDKAEDKCTVFECLNDAGILQRTYSVAIHGKDALLLAKEMCEKKGYTLRKL
jgi:hypothetical protein